MVQKGITGGLFAKANNRYIKDYHKNEELSYLKYWDINSVFGWEMS